MQVRQLRGIPVVDTSRVRKIGKVADFLLDAETASLAGIEVNVREGGTIERVPAQLIQRLGHHAIMLDPAWRPESPDQLDPNRRWLNQRTLPGLEIIGDDGLRVGNLVDAQINQNTLQVDTYVLQTGPFAWFRRQLEPSRVRWCSSELMICQNPRTVHELGAPMRNRSLSMFRAGNILVGRTNESAHGATSAEPPRPA